jgi:type IV pilus assembly protein PilB
MEPRRALRLGDLLVEAGALREDVEAAAEPHGSEKHAEKLGARLVQRGAIDERMLYRALSRQTGVPLAELDEVINEADPALFRAVSRRFLDAHAVVPFKRVGNVVFAVSTEPDGGGHELAWALSADRVELALLPPTELRRLVTALELGQTGRARESGAAAEEEPADVTRGAVDSELVSLWNAIVADAVAERASDIHLERYREGTRVRFRIDGDLHDVSHYALTPAQYRGIINVLKIRAELDISERRLPQGGRYQAHAETLVFDLRVQTQPALHGEHAVVRLLPQEQATHDLDSLGFSQLVVRSLRRLLDSPAGLVLVVGPTGSGKSTTLYAGLQILAKDTTRKVITVEDPIEYALAGIQQTRVRPDIGFNFSDAMRVFVREDPDVILVGEIRDGETALEALRASQTGHLVLSTLHCNDSIDAAQRLLDLGMHPNSVASELLAVFSQRLARRLCPRCRVEHRPAEELLREVFPAGAPPTFKAWKGMGCAHCRARGTHGRIALAEYLQVGPALRLAIAARQPPDALRAEARRAGLVPLREQALALVQEGIIGFEELRSLLSWEQLSSG